MLISDIVLIIDPDGYVGKDTQDEIEWAMAHGLNVMHFNEFKEEFIPKDGYVGTSKPAGGDQNE